MFRIAEIKNANRRGSAAKKHRKIPPNELQQRRPDERTVPYFSTVPEQLEKDERFNKLPTFEKGLFLLLCMKLWIYGGLAHNFPAGNAKMMGLSPAAWNDLQTVLTDHGLVALSDDGIFIYQPELREQYIQFLEAHPGAEQ